LLYHRFFGSIVLLKHKKPVLSSFPIFNGLIFLFCLPWIIFVVSNYTGRPIAEELRITKHIYSFWSSLCGILHDWTPYAPLMITSVVMLILFPFLSRNRKNAIVLLSVFILPIGGLILFCKLLNYSHFITSRYFIGFSPLFLILLYLSIDAFVLKFENLKRWLRLKLFFIILFVISNLIILPLYYRSEKQDFRGLANFLKGEVQDGDKINLSTVAQFPGLLHDFGVYPGSRRYFIPNRRISKDEFEGKYYLMMENKTFVIACSSGEWIRFDLPQSTLGGKRFWFVVNKITAQRLKGKTPCILKGYFDSSFLNFNKFPTDDSMYLFLWDPNSPNEKGIDIPIE
jgi:hypothetical protein